MVLLLVASTPATTDAAARRRPRACKTESGQAGHESFAEFPAAPVILPDKFDQIREFVCKQKENQTSSGKNKCRLPKPGDSFSIRFVRTVVLMVKTTSAIHHARRILAQGPYYSCDPSLLLKAAANVKLAPNLKIFVIPLHPRSPFVSQSGKVILPQVAKAPLPNLDSLVARQETTKTCSSQV